jgi:hypothetical protein
MIFVRHRFRDGILAKIAGSHDLFILANNHGQSANSFTIRTYAKNAPVTRLESALPKIKDLKSFRINTYRKDGGAV